MKKIIAKLTMMVGLISTSMFMQAQNVHAYTIDRTYALGTYQGSSVRTSNDMIIAHAVGAYSSAKNNAIYMHNNYNNTYTQYIVGDGGHVYQIGADGYVAYGAYDYANNHSPVQVELAQTYNHATFLKDYAVYVQLIRDKATQYGIPKVLDDSTYRGVKSHYWISTHIYGDHSDPYNYLPSQGISTAQFAHDIAYGITSSNTNTNNSNNSASNKPATNGTWHKESATFINGNQGIQVRYGLGLSAKKAGILPAYAHIKYDKWAVKDGYTWVHYVGYNGKNLYLPVRPTGYSAWGTFK